MKNKYSSISPLTLILMVLFVSCGSSGGNPPASIPIALEGLDGASGVAVDSSFLYTFEFEIDASTVTTSTYFIVPTIAADLNIAVEKSEYSSDVCDVNRALAATVSCDSNTECLLDPTDNLNEGTSYTVCLTSEILKATGEAITPVAITFTTEGSSFGIAAVLDGKGVPLSSTGSTGVAINQFTIYFTEEIESGAETDLSCDLPEGSAISQPSIDGSESSESAVTFTVEDAYQYQLMDCTLTVGSGYTGESGGGLGSDATYAFTAGCALSDDFNSITDSCWSVMPGGSSQSWDALLGTIDPATSSLDVDFTALSSGNGGLSKEVTVNEDEFSITINFSNFTVTPGQSDDVIVVGVVENNDATNGNALGRAFLAGMGVRMGVENNACLAMFGTSDSDTTDFSQRCATDGAYSVRLTYSSGQVETFYSTNGTDFPSMGTATTDIDISQLGYAIISFIRQYGSNTAQIDSVVFEGATSTTQY